MRREELGVEGRSGEGRGAMWKELESPRRKGKVGTVGRDRELEVQKDKMEWTNLPNPELVGG